MRCAAVVLALVGVACGKGFHVDVNAQDTTSTTAIGAQAGTLPLTYESGTSRFDPPGDVAPRMTANEAYAAWDERQDPPSPGASH